MRLHRITLRDVRGVSERTVTFPDRGVVVVEGPNEVGKSTLLDAFDRLLELKSTSASAQARALQPIGRDVGPFVEAEFTLAGQRVRLAKQWLRGQLTELEVFGPVPEQLSGAAAQARLDQLLAASLDPTLWEALRFTQSGDGSVVPLVSSGVLREALDAAADAHLHDGSGEKVLDLVEREYLQYFTARTGRPTGDYKSAAADHAAAQQQVAEAHRRLVEAESLLERQGAARESVDGSLARVDEARQGLAAAQQRAEEVAVVVAALERAAAALAQATERAAAADRELEVRRRATRALERGVETVESLTQQMVAAERRAETLRPAVQEAEAALTAADERVDAAEAAQEQARADLDLLDEQTRLADLERAVQQIEERMGAVRRARDGMPSAPVGEEDRRGVAELGHELAVLVARHEAASPRVEVEALGEAALVQGEAIEGESVEPGDTCSFVATDDLEVLVPGAVRLRVQPAGDARERRQRVDAAREALEQALRALDCRDVQEVEDRAAATLEARHRESQALQDLRTVLSALGLSAQTHRADAEAGQVPATLIASLDAARARVSRAMGRRTAAAPDLPPDLDQAREAERVSAHEARTCREARRVAAAELSLRRTEVQEVGARLDRLAGQLEAERAQLETTQAELEQARAISPDETLAQHASELATALRAAVAQEQQARAEASAADADGVEGRVRSARADLARAEAELERAREVLHTVTGQVELAASEGRQELYDLAEAALEETERRLAALDRRARAARHLRTTLLEHRDAAHRAYVTPFTRALELLGRRVYGESFGVVVDEQLSVRARTLHGTSVPFEDLSGGAKEQLGILARLAVAQLVDPAQGVPVVIDDALGATDPQRLEQMGRVLGASAGPDGDDVQVILLTCTPARYAGIPQVQTVRLSA